MRVSEIADLAYFSFLTSLALVWRLPAHSRIKAILIGLIGLAATAAGVAAPDIVRDWLPVVLIVLAYGQSGCFFQKANPKLQSMFENSERAISRLLRIDLGGWADTTVGSWLEFAYVFCYPVVPLGLAALYLSGFRHAADEYWTVVLLSAYPCYVLLPFVQLLPPRLVERTDAPVDRGRAFRRFNLWLVRRVTHEANTFPSGHVATSAAIALVLLRFTPAAGIVFALIACGIAAGCIVGRYHYIVDVGAALILASTIFAIETACVR